MPEEKHKGDIFRVQMSQCSPEISCTLKTQLIKTLG